MPAEAPPRELTIRVARSVLDAAGSLLPFQATAETPAHIIWTGGFVARCRQLLSGLVTLVECGDDDAVGVLYRTLLETFLSGTYALLGRDEALGAMHQALLHDTHELEVALGRTERQNRPEQANKLPVSNYKGRDGLIERVDRLLAEQNDQYGGWAPAIHRTQYRTLSLHDAHGGLGCLQGYVDTQAGASIVGAERGAEGVAVFLLNHAVAHVGTLAALWAREAGLDASHLSTALQRWEEAQPDSRGPRSSE